MSRSAGNISAVWGNPLRHGAEHVVLRERWEKGAEVQGLSIELAEGFSEPPAIDLSHEVSCRLFVENCPATDGAFVRLAFCPPEEKRGRMLGLGDERFQPKWGNDSEICFGHTNLSTITCGEM